MSTITPIYTGPLTEKININVFKPLLSLNLENSTCFPHSLTRVISARFFYESKIYSKKIKPVDNNLHCKSLPTVE